MDEADKRAALARKDAEAAPGREDSAKSTNPTEQQQQRCGRLHFLDWLRLLMVLGVVYAHAAKSGVTTGGGFSEAWLVDDRTLFDHNDYVELYANLKHEGGNGPVSGQCVPTHVATARHPPRILGRSPLAVRWISIARQWCLPLLFWVSGAAVACSYRGAPKGLVKLLGFTALGMGFNAILWFLGPMDDQCFVGNPDCAGMGLVFSFTIVPFAGAAFAVLFQMWYTVMLMGFCLLNWPFLAVVHGSVPKAWALLVQLSIWSTVYLCCLYAAGAWEFPWALAGKLVATEALFLGLLPLAAPSFEGMKRPAWLPLRAVHYMLALVAILQFGALPFARQMESIGMDYILYVIVGFNRFFGLGFLMTVSRFSPAGDEADPLLSSVWPLALVVFTCTAPSTNWDLAGMLTYPFFLTVPDRLLYVAGAVCVVFLLDRCSRCMPCRPLPGVLSQASLILYLFHPVIATVLLHFGMRSVPLLWLATAGMALAIAGLLEWSWPPLGKDTAESPSSDDE